jgi:hypothetical protein
MTLYKRTCAYRDLDGEIFQESKVIEADSKQAAMIIFDNFFYSKHWDLPKDHLLFSTIKEVSENTSTIASGAGSVAIRGNTNGVTIQTGHNNINIGNANGLHIGETLYSYL